MGRKASAHSNLPPRMRARTQRSGVTYYYYDTGAKPRKEIPLGPSYVDAVIKWTELEKADLPAAIGYITFKDVADRYLKEIIPTKADRTQRDNIKELANLLAFFNNPPAPLDEIRPLHVRMYLDSRKEAKTRANREKALFSHIFNKAREWGYTDKENPCRGVEGFEETGRDNYVSDAVYQALWDAASEPVRDAIDLAYLTGQRPADTLKMQQTDIRDGAIMVKQGKTKQKLRVAIVGKLAAVIDRIMLRKAGYQVHNLALIVNEEGKRLTASALDNRWDHVRSRAAVAHPELKDEIMSAQFRDLRAKAGTDKESSDGMAAAKDQLGHADEKMTRQYVRHRLGKLVTPTK